VIVQKKVLIVFEISLLVLLGFAAFYHFYWTAPSRHLSDSEWCTNHSSQQQWVELQKQIRRTGPDHESRLLVGLWGDRSWAEWIISRIQSRIDFRDCAEGHLDEALIYLTNQKPGENLQAWLNWWATNSNKTQVEWIHSGFAQRGIYLSDPLAETNKLALLRFLAPSTNSNAFADLTTTEKAALRYNSFRWLRDSRVSLAELANISVSPDEADVLERGIARFNEFLKTYGSNAPGVLALRSVGSVRH
jgi:hypothetical protein